MHKLGIFALLASSALAACAQPTDVAPGDEPPAEIDSPLYGGGNWALWPGGVVPVCWVSGTNEPTRQARARAILEETWSRVAQITFVGWGTCGSSTTNVVQVHFQAGTRGSTNKIGYVSDSTVELISDGTDEHFRYEVIHEFGHVLGFAHEQERPDNWDSNGVPINCNRLDNGRQAVPGGVYYTSSYDKSSVMNYCAGWVQNLSPGDISGIRAAYGLRMTTNVAPAVASTSDGVLFFAKDPDGRIYEQRVVLGQAGQHWRELEGGGRTDAAPAAALCGNAPYVFAAVKGLDNNVWINQGDLGRPYVGWGTDGRLKTNVAPAVATTPNGVIFFATRQDGRIFANRVVLGQAGQGWVELEGNGGTDAAPAAALVGNAPYVFVAVKGYDGYVYINQGDLGRPYVGWRSDYAFKTNVAPAVATTPDGVIFYAKDLQGRIFANRVVLGQAGQGWVELQGNGRTDAAPAAALVGRVPYIFAAVKGLDGFVYINQGDLGRPYVGWRRD
jgi:hypothetical protein